MEVTSKALFWVSCSLFVFIQLSLVHSHAGCPHHHDHGHDDHQQLGSSTWEDKAASKVPPPSPKSHHGHHHEAHSHHHDHHHHAAESHSGDRAAAAKQKKQHTWRSDLELAEEEELSQHGFGEPDSDDFDHYGDGSFQEKLSGIWMQAIGSSLLVSFVSLICLVLVPLISANGKPSKAFVDTLAAFGVGAMLGDSFFHQLPHAYGSGGHSHDHSAHSHEDHGHAGHDHGHEDNAGAAGHAHSLADLSVGISVLAGILLFFLVEKVVRKVEDMTSKGVRPAFGHAHHHHRFRKSASGREAGAEGHGSDGEEQHEDKDAVADEETKKESSEIKDKEVKKEADAKAADKEEEKTVAAEGKKDEGSAAVKSTPAKGGKGKGKGKGGKGGAKSSEEEGGAEEKEVEDGFVLAEGRGGLRRRKSGRTGKVDGETEGEEKAAEEQQLEETGRSSKRRKSGEAQGKAGLGTQKEGGKGEQDVGGESAGEAGGKAVAPPTVAKTEEHEPHSSSLVLGYLNLFSDGVHNFTDGMALGSAFLHHGPASGYSRMLFMLAHEIPQEIGDFGILVRSGLGVLRALWYNFLSALMAVAGAIVALAVGGSIGSSSLVEGFTAGGFIYIAVAGVIPEMHSASTSLRTTLIQVGALVIGMGVALVISMVE